MSSDTLLLRQVAMFDAQHFDQESWTYETWRDEKTAHIQLHVAKAALRVTDWDDERVQQQVMPDLALYRSQLANLHKLFEGDSAAKESFLFKRRPTRPQVDNALKQLVLKKTVEASGSLAGYLEPAQHGRVPYIKRVKAVERAARCLDDSACALATAFGVNLEDALFSRITR